MGNGSATAADVITLPHGGGAQRGIGETFSPDLQTGTGNVTVPLSIPPGRNNLHPSLNLSYSTGYGNGSFGLGWTLSLPSIARKTSRGIPRYRDTAADSADWDTFILSSSEDLVPIDGGSHYRPHTEGLFARIERHRVHGGDWWEVHTRDGLTSTYGTHRDTTPPTDWRDPATLADPSDPTHIVEWKLSETRDPFGNRIVYDYLTDLDPATTPRWVQSYPHLVRYVDIDAAPGFLVSVAFDYEPRPDAFTDHRAGFPVRTTRRCSTITVRTHAGQDRTVRAYRLTYEQAPFNGASLLRQVQLSGSDDTETMPPLEFGYTRFEPATHHDLLPVTSPDAPPASLANPDFDLIDLSGDGLPDVIQLNGVARTWRNRGGGHFDRPTTMPDAPAGITLADPGVQLMDADGDGRADLVVTRQGIAGHWPLRHDGQWDRASFRKYRQAPTFSLADPDVRLVDLNGDGIADLIRAGPRLSCIFYDPETASWNDPVWLQRGILEDLRSVSFADLRVKWADLSGDGLQDLAIVHQGSVRYWPNQGHGKWGHPVTMSIPHRLPWGYNPNRLVFGDLDGDGMADMAYIQDNTVTLWINRGGTAWSEPVTIAGTPSITDADSVRVVDLLGSGVSGILYTANATNGFPRANFHFLDLTGAAKPYLLDRMDNHLGAVTRIAYRSSTIDYLRDEADPHTRWRTTLPFPVQVVGKVEVIDAISKGKLTTEYRYHHGYWDGNEREFRGFGMVEQADTETFQRWRQPGLHGDTPFTPLAEASFSLPVLTKTWFHLGPVSDDAGDWRELDYTREFWSSDPSAFTRHESVTTLLATTSQRRARRDILRTLRGRPLRTEQYGLDGTARQDRPYTVTESQYGLREEAPPGNDVRRRIFFPFLVATRTTQWERGNDPQTHITLSGTYDSSGQPLSQTDIALPRREACRLPVPAAVIGIIPGDVINETRILATHTRTSYAVPNPTASITDRVAHVRTVELATPPTLSEQDPNDLVQILRDGLDAAQAIHQTFADACDGWNPGDPIPTGLRLTGHTIHRYDGPAFIGLDPGQLGTYGALTHTETLTFVTDETHDAEDTLDRAFGNRRPAYLDGPANLPAGAPAGFGENLGYRRVTALGTGYHDGYYATTVSRRLDVQDASATQQRGFVTGTRDSLGNEVRIAPDANWHLPAAVTDPAGLVTSITYDPRFLLPATVTDVNGHISTYTYTPLGLLATMFLDRGTADRPELAYTYGFDAYDATRNTPDPQPIWVHTAQRVWHALDGPPAGIDANPGDVIESREFSDGFGRLIQKRAQADPLMFGTTGDDSGLTVAGEPVPGQAGGPVVGQRTANRVIVSGWQVNDNKGRPVERYEPFFATGWSYEPESEARRGHHTDLFYDPRGRIVRTVNPDGSEQRLVTGVPPDPAHPGDPDTFTPSPWEIYAYDSNDLAALSADQDGESLADRAPIGHHYTPASTITDALGRVTCAIARNGSNPTQDWFVTRSLWDGRGNHLAAIDALGRTAFEYAYDLQNHQLAVSSMDAGHRTSILDANGSLAEFRDSKGSITLRQWDRLNRLTAVWSRDDATGPVTLRERLEYGDGGTPDQPATNRAAGRARNQLGRLVRHFDEAGLLTCDGYDPIGNLVEKGRRVVSDEAIRDGWTANWAAPNADQALEPGSHRTSTVLDALNRPVSLIYPAQTDGARPILKPRYTRTGALESVTLDDVTYIERIAYNARGQRILVVYGNGTMTRYAYDPFMYRLVRLRSERTLIPAPTSDRWTGQGQPLQDLTYRYDLAANVTRIEEHTPGCGVAGSSEGRDRLTRTFAYDALYRLVEATGRACSDLGVPRPAADLARCGSFPAPHRSGSATPNQHNAPDLTERYTETFTYDPIGNLLKLAYIGAPGHGFNRESGLGGEPASGWANALTNHLTSLADGAPIRAYTYDANGNLLSENTERHYTWDHADHLTGFTIQPAGGTTPSVEARYLYGADGQRVKKWVRTGGTGDGESTTFIDGIFEHLRRQSPSQEGNVVHVIDGARHIALVRRGPAHDADAGPPIEYHLADHLGSSSLVVGDDGSWCNREEYFPYGETSFGGYARKRYRFAGKERDEESGLSYHGARYYAPTLARWTNCDPLGIAPGANLYLYAHDNPIRWSDPSGLAPICEGQEGCSPNLKTILNLGWEAYSWENLTDPQKRERLTAEHQQIKDREAEENYAKHIAKELEGGVLDDIGNTLKGWAADGARWFAETKVGGALIDANDAMSTAAGDIGASGLQETFGPISAQAQGYQSAGATPGAFGRELGEFGYQQLRDALVGKMGVAAVGKLMSVMPLGLTTKSLTRIHHIATNKGKIGWADEFARMFKIAGVDLDDDINKVVLPAAFHRSSHGNPYHTWVYSELLEATETATIGLSPGTAAYKAAYRKGLMDRLEDIKTHLLKHPEMVTKQWWKTE